MYQGNEYLKNAKFTKRDLNVQQIMSILPGIKCSIQKNIMKYQEKAINSLKSSFLFLRYLYKKGNNNFFFPKH